MRRVVIESPYAGVPGGAIWKRRLSSQRSRSELPDKVIRHWVHVSVAANLLLDQMVDVMKGR